MGGHHGVWEYPWSTYMIAIEEWNKQNEPKQGK